MAHEPSSGPAETGSRTTTQTGTPTQGDGRQEDRAGPSQPVVGVLKLRGDRPVRRQKVGWTEGTIDNEGLGKKKSKSMSLTPLADLWRVAYIGAVCCIYHKPKTFDESSDESSSDESDCDHRHHPKHERGHTTRRRGVDKASEQEQSDNGSSESEGGAGDGRARPPKKSGRHPDLREGQDKHARDPPQANKYDLPAPGSTVLKPR